MLLIFLGGFRCLKMVLGGFRFLIVGFFEVLLAKCGKLGRLSRVGHSASQYDFLGFRSFAGVIQGNNSFSQTGQIK